jgi:Asp-tRNA(Asn)/Glu-tRNA(Gln) amidotransferase A subunit family amidase
LESKPKVGILIETPILQVSKSVKRALSITRKALQEQGFEVVDVQITPEEYAEGRDLLIGMVATGGGPGTMRDFERSGEHTMFSVWMNFFLLSRSSCTQWVIKKLMSSIGMGRGAAMLKEFNMRNEEQFELFMKRRYEFAYKMSEKW